MFYLIKYSSDWSPLLPVAIGILLYKRINADSKLIFLISLFGLIPQLIHFYYVNSEAEFISYNLYSPTEYLIFYLLFKKKMIFKKLNFTFNIITVIYIIFSFSLVIQNGITHRFINQWDLLNNIIYLIWIGLYLYQSFDIDTGELARYSPFLWHVLGILLYSSCTTVVYSLWQKILNSPKESVLKYLFNIQNVFNIILYIFFSVGILMNIKKMANKNN